MTTTTKLTPIDNTDLARVTGGYHDQLPSPGPVIGGAAPGLSKCPPSHPNTRPSPVWIPV